ncbi:MAG: hypothetical protein HY678_11480 [Chloroflexi bacterium]|nr:hypothetical protein [Chloroflexota bacterium]
MKPAETLKQRINKGDQVVGVGVPMSATRARLEAVLSKDDYDFVSVDSQHSPFNEDTLVQFSGIAAELGIPAMFRIKHTRHAYLIGNLLDLGPAGVEVPQVEDEATVDEARSYFYYPQLGKRSWGGAARWGVKGRDDRLAYAEWWNTHGVLWMQIESINAVTNARKLAKRGVDCLSWGPADLSFSREANPQHPLKTDDDCVRYTVKVLEGTGVRLCVRSYDPNLRNKYRDLGATVLLERPKT